MCRVLSYVTCRFSQEVARSDLEPAYTTRKVDLDGAQLEMRLTPGKTKLVLERNGHYFVLENKKNERQWREYFYKKFLNKDNLFTSYSNEGIFGGRQTITIRAKSFLLIGWEKMPKARYVSETFPIIVDTSGELAELTFLTPDGLNEWAGINIFVPAAAQDSEVLLMGDQYRRHLEQDTLAITLNETIDHDILNHAPAYAEMMKTETGDLYRQIMATVRAVNSNKTSTSKQLLAAKRAAEDINGKFEVSTFGPSLQLILGNREPFDKFLAKFDLFLKEIYAELKSSI